MVITRWTLRLSSFRWCMICGLQCWIRINVAVYWRFTYSEKKKSKKEKEKSHSKVGSRWVRQKALMTAATEKTTSLTWSLPLSPESQTDYLLGKEENVSSRQMRRHQQDTRTKLVGREERIFWTRRQPLPCRRLQRRMRQWTKTAQPIFLFWVGL